MSTTDMIVFFICALGIVLGAYTITLSRSVFSFLKFGLACLFSGGSLIFYYYHFAGSEPLILTFMYYSIILGSALFFSKINDRSTS